MQQGGGSVNPEISGPFRKASYSQQAGACVEVAPDVIGGRVVRDSKDKNGPLLNFTADAWSAFLAVIKSGDMAN